MEGVSDAAKPVLFATLIILVAFIPLFTMQGVPGKIFAPMSVTYGFALTGALIFALRVRLGAESPGGLRENRGSRPGTRSSRCVQGGRRGAVQVLPLRSAAVAA